MFVVPAAANGMGGASVASTESGSEISNPAALSIYHLDHGFRLMAPSSTQWAPNFGPSINLKSWGVSAGRHVLGTKAKRNDIQLLLALGYTHTELDLGLTTFVNTQETIIGIAPVSEESDALVLSVALGLRNRVQLGVGLSVKHLNETVSDFFVEYDPRLSKSTNTAHDIGAFVYLPVINRDRTSKQGRQGSLSLSAGFVLANLGSEVRTILDGGYYVDSLPRVERVGGTVTGALRFSSWLDLSTKLIYERETDRIGNLLPIERRGMEIGFNNALFIRRGQFSRGFDNSDVKTWGAGFKLRGLLDWILGEQSRNDDSKQSRIFMRHLDITIDYARYSGDILSGTEFLQTSISF